MLEPALNDVQGPSERRMAFISSQLPTTAKQGFQNRYRRSTAVSQTAMLACTVHFWDATGTITTHAQQLYRQISWAGHQFHMSPVLKSCVLHDRHQQNVLSCPVLRLASLVLYCSRL